MGTQSGGPGRLGLLGRSAWSLSLAAKLAHSLLWAFDGSLGPGLQLQALSLLCLSRSLSLGLSLLRLSPSSPFSPSQRYPLPTSLLSGSGAGFGKEPLCWGGWTEPGAWDTPVWPLILALPLLSICMTLGKSLNPSEPQFPRMGLITSASQGCCKLSKGSRERPPPL